MRHARAAFAVALFAAAAAPAYAADLGRPSARHAAPVSPFADYEVRKYYMDSGRAYGEPVREYIRITPAPPVNRLLVAGPRGYARVVIDDRPDINSPVYIPILE